MAQEIERNPAKPPYEKHAISLPPELAAAAREEMRARGLASFSAYVAEAIRRDLDSRKFDELLDEMFGAEPATAEEQAWAQRALYG